MGTEMQNSKTNKIIYWILTAAVLLPMAGSGFPELFSDGPAQTVQSLQTLGYPLYLMKILGLAKILGALAIITNRFPKLKEWAYAGYTFNLLGATASHILAGDGVHAPIPFTMFVLLMGSYFLWRKEYRA
jgi:uncharacterized membrane protein YphA (DoxX/SURF4 family)